MDFPQSVLKWSNVVASELSRGKYPFPTEYPLSVMLVESRGYPGLVNPNSGASGIMQVMPGTLQDYNKHNSPPISLGTLRAKEAWAVPEQIRAGTWVMGRYVKQGYKWISETNPDPSLSDLIRISDLMYVRGPAGTRKDFKNLTSRTFSDLEAARPNYQPFAHPRKVWKWTSEKNHPTWDMGALNAWVSGESTPDVIPPPTIATHTGFLGALLLLAFAGLYFSKQKN